MWREPDGLIKAEVTLSDAPTSSPLPERYSALAEVLAGLLRHPQIQRLKLESDLDDAWSVPAQLTQLLPIDEAIKYRLQGLTSAERLLEEMDKLLVELSGEPAAGTRN